MGRGTRQEDSWLARAGLRRLAGQIFFQVLISNKYLPFANSCDFTRAGLRRLASQIFFQILVLKYICLLQIAIVISPGQACAGWPAKYSSKYWFQTNICLFANSHCDFTRAGLRRLAGQIFFQILFQIICLLQIYSCKY